MGQSAGACAAPGCLPRAAGISSRGSGARPAAPEGIVPGVVIGEADVDTHVKAAPVVVAEPLGIVPQEPGTRGLEADHTEAQANKDILNHLYAAQRVAASPRECAVLQSTKVSAGLPPEIRLKFVVKVYGILGVMLAITFGLTVPFILHTESTVAWFRSNVFVLYVVLALLGAMYLYHLCMLCGMCCGSQALVEAYLKMMQTVPWNYLYLFTFAGCFGVTTGFTCAAYTAESVLVAFAATVLLVAALSVYAVKTKADFTGYGGYAVVLLVGLMLSTIIAAFFPGSSFVSKLVAGAGAIVFGFIIVYDTQLIFGSISGKRDFEYTLDMYAFAAWNLYLDFINFFLYLLQFLGQRE